MRRLQLLANCSKKHYVCENCRIQLNASLMSINFLRNSLYKTQMSKPFTRKNKGGVVADNLDQIYVNKQTLPVYNLIQYKFRIKF